MTLPKSKIQQTFTQELALKLLTKDKNRKHDIFPVDFHYAWQWLDYSSKDDAREFLQEHFEQNLDYHITVRDNKQIISLTIDCFKSWGMLVGGPKGKLIRKYFLECERLLTNTQPKLPIPKTLPEALRAYADEIDKRMLLEQKVHLMSQKLDQLEPIVETYQSILHPGVCLTIEELASALNLPELSKNKLTDFLKERQFINKSNGLPSKFSLDRRLLITDLSTHLDSFGKVHTSTCARITFKGMKYIIRELIKAGYKVNSNPKFIWDTYYSEYPSAS